MPMEMTRLEKWFVNRRKKAERNISRVHRCLQKIPSNAIRDVLELGCGAGAVSADLAATYEMNVQGTDYDSKQIEIARNMQPESEHLHYRVEDATRLTLQDANFDLVISQNVFHHLADWKAAVQEVARVLRPGGFFMWFDLVFPKPIGGLFQPLFKNHSLYCFADVRSAFEITGFRPLFHERLVHGLFVHHHLVCQKSEEK
jgi:ubiquinone/menaquinone biosynthesis C-methylase UbiE